VSGGDGNDTIVDGNPGSSTLTYQEQLQDLGAVAYWNMDETSGTSAGDMIGTNDATYLSNTDPNQLGVDSDTGVYLNGSNSSNGNGYVEVTNDPVMQLAEGTYQLWINPDDVSGTQYIFDQYDGNGAQYGLRLYIKDGVLYGSITDDYSTQTVNSGVAVVGSGSWQHVGISFGDGALTIYHDGAEVGSVASSGDLTSNTEELWIGARQDGSWNENHFQGYVDEFAIHDSALTETQMTDLFAAGPTDGSSVAIADTYDGGAGIDEVDYSGSTEAVNVDLGAGTGTGGSADGDSYTDIENVTGSAHDDVLTGSGDANVLDGGAGDDTLSGGAGDDVYILQDGFGNDYILDFDTGDSDLDGFFNDQLDVTGLTDALGNPVNAWDVTVSDDGSGNALLTFPNGESLVLVGVAPSSIDSAQELNSAGIVCFAEGTRIRTPRGEVPVEELAPGDWLETMDCGPEQVVWAGRRDVGKRELAAKPSLKPVRIPAGLLGSWAPLFVSPQHGILVDDAHGAIGQRLARARHLAEAKGPVRVANGKRRVAYFHLMFATHQIVWANGVASESFYPGPHAMKMLDAASRRELRNIVGDLDRRPVHEVYGVPARKFLRRKDVLKFTGLRRRPNADRKAARVSLQSSRLNSSIGGPRSIQQSVPVTLPIPNRTGQGKAADFPDSVLPRIGALSALQTLGQSTAKDFSLPCV
ncbi:MAG: Hint domain-containing protein, partial [Ruegeria sp.]